MRAPHRRAAGHGLKLRRASLRRHLRNLHLRYVRHLLLLLPGVVHRHPAADANGRGDADRRRRALGIKHVLSVHLHVDVCNTRG